MTHYHTHRRPGPVAAAFWLVLLIAMIPASFSTPGMAWLGVVLIIVLPLVVLGKVSPARQRATTVAQRPVVRQVVQAPARVLYRSRCDHCGAPRRHGAQSCRFCGRSLVVL